MKGVKTKKELSPEQREELLIALKARFERNMNRHEGLEWTKVKAKLEAGTEKLWSVSEMERTDGEPDVVGHDKKTGEYIFFDCSPESPKEAIQTSRSTTLTESEKGSLAAFLDTGITGNLSGLDVDCEPQFPITRGVETTGGITNCVESASKSQLKTMK